MLPEPCRRLAAVVRPVVAHAEVVSDLVRDGVGEREARVLVDVAAALRLTHAGHLGQPQRRAQLQPGRAHVEPGDQYGKVVVVGVALVGRVDKPLPAAEALQSPVRRFVDAQLIKLLGRRQRFFLRSFGLEEDHTDQHHVDGVADACIVEQRGHHVEHGEEVRLQVLVGVVLHHGTVGHQQRLHVALQADRAPRAPVLGARRRGSAASARPGVRRASGGAEGGRSFRAVGFA